MLSHGPSTAPFSSRSRSRLGLSSSGPYTMSELRTAGRKHSTLRGLACAPRGTKTDIASPSPALLWCSVLGAQHVKNRDIASCALQKRYKLVEQLPAHGVAVGLNDFRTSIGLDYHVNLARLSWSITHGDALSAKPAHHYLGSLKRHGAGSPRQSPPARASERAAPGRVGWPGSGPPFGRG